VTSGEPGRDWLVRLGPGDEPFRAAEGETVLDAGRRAGIDLPHACRGGRCGLCAARLLEGRIDFGPAVHRPRRKVEFPRAESAPVARDLDADPPLAAAVGAEHEALWAGPHASADRERLLPPFRHDAAGVEAQRARREREDMFCETSDQVAAATTSLLGMLDLYGQRMDAVLVQRLAHGPLFEVCMVSQGGRHDVVMVVETTKRGSVYDAMRIVYEDEMAALGAVCRYGLAVLDALEIGYGAAHVEVMVDEGQSPY